MRLHAVWSAASAVTRVLDRRRALAIVVGALTAIGAERGAFAQAFVFTPPANLGDIISAKFVGNFAGLTAHRYVGETEVNRITLADSDRTLAPVNLSDAFFGTAMVGQNTRIMQNNMQTGLFDAAIPASFFPVLLKGKVDLIGVITDTVDSAFAIDSLYIEINTTSRGLVRAFYGSGLDGFLASPPIPIGGNLPDDVSVVLPANRTGTGFDETISSKAFDVPGPASIVAGGLVVGLAGGRRRRPS